MLPLTDHPLIAERGRKWVVTASGHFDPAVDVYRLTAVLRYKERRVTGQATIPGSVAARFETERELRAFVIRERGKHLGRTPLADGFAIEPPLKFML